MTHRDLLAGSALLRGFSPKDLDVVLDGAHLRELRRDQALFEPGDPADTVVLVLEGALTVEWRADALGQSTVRRHVERGGTVGEEALLLAAGSRTARCEAECSSIVAELSAVALERAAVRSGGAPLWEKLRRRARRAWVRAVLASAVEPADLERVVDGARLEQLRAGDGRATAPDEHGDRFVVAQGVCVTVDSVGAPLARHDAGLWGTLRQNTSLRALGDAWLVCVAASLAPEIVDRSSPIATSMDRVVSDVRRLGARSLLVLDASRCVDCHACESACADTHSDGLSRFDRTGASGDYGLEAGAVHAELNACQHCVNPACLPACPVGAIGRSPTGLVMIDSATCTGCGACARACPWDAVRIAPRPADTSGASRTLAVKCDRCGEGERAPACVGACPTAALVRVDGTLAAPQQAEGSGKDASSEREWWWLVAFSGVSGAIATSTPSRVASAVVVAAALIALCAYGVAWRAGVRRAWWPVRGALWMRRGHEALGILTCGAMVAHGAGRAHSPLALAAQVCATLLLTHALAFAWSRRVLPLRVSALEPLYRQVLPPDALGGSDLAAFYAVLAGKAEPVKVVFRRFARPYATNRAGTFGDLLRGLDGGDARLRMHRMVDERLGGRVSERLVGVNEVIDVAIAVRARRASRWSRMLLGSGSRIHMALAYGFAVIAMAHGVAACVGRL